MRRLVPFLIAIAVVSAYSQTFQPRHGQKPESQPIRSNYVEADSTDKLVDVRDLTRTVVLSARIDGANLRMLILRPNSDTPTEVVYSAAGASIGAYISGASVSMNGNILTLNLVDAMGQTSQLMFEPTGQSPPTPTTYTSYVGWSSDRFIGPSDFASASSDTDLMIDLPAQSVNSYIWFAVRSERGYPNHLYYHGVPLDQLSFYERQLGQVTYNSNTYIIGVSRNLQSFMLANTELTIGY